MAQFAGVTSVAQGGCVAEMCGVWGGPLRQPKNQRDVDAGLYAEEDCHLRVRDVK